MYGWATPSLNMCDVLNGTEDGHEDGGGGGGGVNNRILFDLLLRSMFCKYHNLAASVTWRIMHAHGVCYLIPVLFLTCESVQANSDDFYLERVALAILVYCSQPTSLYIYCPSVRPSASLPIRLSFMVKSLILW